MSALDTDEAWKEYKNGRSWAKYEPICYTETEDTHRHHMMFIQGWNAAIESSSNLKQAYEKADEEEKTLYGGNA